MRLARVRAMGFTLIEVMVALLIVALALPALITQVLGVVDATVELRDRSLSYWVAENQAARLELQANHWGQTLRGQDQGVEQQAGRDWHWQVESSETGFEGLRRLDISAGPEHNPSLVRLERFVHD